VEAASSNPLGAEARHVRVARTARYYVLGGNVPDPRELWIVVHGYGQLAGRFLRYFTALDDGTRVVVAPEALSRFYHEHPGKAGSAHTRVGATWMTREDREAEIQDHVAYLDTLVAALRASAPAATLHVLGFSQGVATVTRWLARGRAVADQVVLWAGRIPDDVVPMPAGSSLRTARIDVVTGDADVYATPRVREEQRQLIARAGLAVAEHRFDGDHRMDLATLRAVAGITGAAEPGVSAPGDGR